MTPTEETIRGYSYEQLINEIHFAEFWAFGSKSLVERTWLAALKAEKIRRDG